MTHSFYWLVSWRMLTKRSSRPNPISTVHRVYIAFQFRLEVHKRSQSLENFREMDATREIYLSAFMGSHKQLRTTIYGHGSFNKKQQNYF